MKISRKLQRAVQAMIDQEEIVISDKLLREIRIHFNTPVEKLRTYKWIILRIDRELCMDITDFDGKLMGSFEDVHLKEIQFK